MVDHFSLAFGTPSQSIIAEYDARTDAALARLVSTLPTNATQLLLGQLDEALAERDLLWRNVLSGTEDAMQDLLHHLSGTLVASLLMTAMETMNIPWRGSA